MAWALKFSRHYRQLTRFFCFVEVVMFAIILSMCRYGVSAMRFSETQATLQALVQAKG